MSEYIDPNGNPIPGPYVPPPSNPELERLERAYAEAEADPTPPKRGCCGGWLANLIARFRG